MVQRLLPPCPREIHPSSPLCFPDQTGFVADCGYSFDFGCHTAESGSSRDRDLCKQASLVLEETADDGSQTDLVSNLGPWNTRVSDWKQVQVLLENVHGLFLYPEHDAQSARFHIKCKEGLSQRFPRSKSSVLPYREEEEERVPPGEPRQRSAERDRERSSYMRPSGSSWREYDLNPGGYLLSSELKRDMMGIIVSWM